MAKPKLQFLILCDEITEENNKVNFKGLFEVIKAIRIPVRLSKFYLTTRWIGGQGNFKQKVVIKLNGTILFVNEQNFQLNNVNHHHTLVGLIENFIFPSEGIYTIEVFLDSESVISIPLEVISVSRVMPTFRSSLVSTSTT